MHINISKSKSNLMHLKIKSILKNNFNKLGKNKIFLFNLFIMINIYKDKIFIIKKSKSIEAHLL
jgi:hypothetical protein